MINITMPICHIGLAVILLKTVRTVYRTGFPQFCSSFFVFSYMSRPLSEFFNQISIAFNQ